MEKHFIYLIMICATCTSSAIERFCVTVKDNDGLPVSNAVVSLGFSAGHIVFAQGKSYDYRARTDVQGKAEIKFHGKSSQFGWDVEADGYYRSGPHDETLKVKINQIPPMFYTVTALEHEKERTVTIWKRINPQPMYSYRLSNAYVENPKVPVKEGRYGFDLKAGDWIPPFGKGEIVDFYYVRNNDEGFFNDNCVAWLEFEPKCGAYFEKQTGCNEFPSTYCANTNAVFRNRLPVVVVKNEEGNKRMECQDIVKSDEYMVLRTRVKLNSDGNIIEANYSKILGPLRFGRFVTTPSVVFNPRPNDTNLEFEIGKNLCHGKQVHGTIP